MAIIRNDSDEVYTADGTLQTSTPVARDVTAQQNAQTLQQRATAALNANATFLALASPTNAQIVAQVQMLTKECSALIRLMLAQLDTTAGT